MPSSPYYVQAQSDGTFAVLHEHHGLVESDFPYRSTAFDFIAECEANDAEMAQHEIAECDALADFVNSRGGYVAADDEAGQGRARAIDAVLGFLDAHKAALAAQAQVGEAA